MIYVLQLLYLQQFLMIAKYSPCDSLTMVLSVLVASISLSTFPGFGFYNAQDWALFNSLRRESGLGEFSDEAVCDLIGQTWSDQHKEDSQDYCKPQWDGVASCIPSAPINQTAVLPCIEFYHDNEGPKYFDTSCE